MKFPPWIRRAFFWFSVIAGVAAFAGVLYYYDFIKILGQIQAVGWLCVVAYAATAWMTLVIPAIGWQILLRAEGVKAGFWTLVKANMMGFLLNVVTPSLYLGGEPLKTYYVAGACGAPKRRVLATIIVSKFQEFVGIVLAMLLTVFFFISTTDVVSKPHEVTLVFLALMFTAALFLLFYAIVGRLRPTIWVIDRIDKLKFMKGRLHRLRRRAVELEYRVHAAFVHRWKTFLVAQAVTLLSAVSMFLRPMIFVFFLPGPKTAHADSICMIYIIANIINMVQIVPGGLGMHEWGITYYFDLISETQFADPVMTPETAMAYVLVGRFADILFILIGFILVWQAGLMKVARGKEKISLEEETESPEEVPLPDPNMKVLKRLFLAAHHEPTGKTRRFVAGKLEPKPSSLRIAHIENEEGFHLLAYRDDESLMTDTFHRTLESALSQAKEEYRVKPDEWEDVKPL